MASSSIESLMGVKITAAQIVMTALGLIGARVAVKAFEKAGISSRLSNMQRRKKEQLAERIESAHLFEKKEEEQDGDDGKEDEDEDSLHHHMDDEDIRALSATQLVEQLKQGKLSSLQVTKAFCRHAARVHAKHKALSEIFFADALKRAQELDEMFARGQLAGPLHGLPVSLKDCVNIAGQDTTLGLIGAAFKPAERSSLLVELLEEAGAVLYCKTNVPQTMLSFECCNPLYGKTSNPYSLDHTPGGSSGGEAVLLAHRASPLGLGTDIGGSVRIPAHFSGVYSIKPTNRRLTTMNFRSSVPGQIAVPGVAGPMGNSVDDLALFLRVTLTERAFEQDHKLVPLPFNEELFRGNGGRKLRIGYYTHDGFMPPSPGCVRAVEQAVEALRAQGHELVEWTPPRVRDAVPLFYALMSADYGKTMMKQLKGEPKEGFVKNLVGMLRMPAPLKWLAVKVTSALGWKRSSSVLNALKYRTVTDTWALQAESQKYRQETLDSFREAKLDVVLTPSHTLPAIPHGGYGDCSFSACYTFLYNLLDWPAGVCPITRVSDGDDYSTPPVGILEKKARKQFSVEKARNLPLGVQIAAPPFEDETVLYAMRELEAAVPFDLSVARVEV